MKISKKSGKSQKIKKNTRIPGPDSRGTRVGGTGREAYSIDAPISKKVRARRRANFFYFSIDFHYFPLKNMILHAQEPGKAAQGLP